MTDKKVCSMCGENKTIDMFRKRSDCKNSYKNKCLSCMSSLAKKSYLINKNSILEKRRKYVLENSDHVNSITCKSYNKNRVKRLEGVAKYREHNPDKIKEASRLSYLKYRDSRIANASKYAKTNRRDIQVKRNRRRLIDINYKISTNLRNRLNRAISKEWKSGSAVSDLGCSIDYLKSYLESKFQPGMTWDNWSRTGWHIDHILPLSRFDLADREELLKACHYTNLQPLWAKENISKGNR